MRTLFDVDSASMQWIGAGRVPRSMQTRVVGNSGWMCCHYPGQILVEDMLARKGKHATLTGGRTLPQAGIAAVRTRMKNCRAGSGSWTAVALDA